MTDWTAAACIGCRGRVATMTPDEAARVAQSRRICGGCPIAEACLLDAIATRAIGVIRGGMTDQERDWERKRRGLAKPTVARDVMPCGTSAGFRRHYRRNEVVCDQCRQAESVRRARSRGER